MYFYLPGITGNTGLELERLVGAKPRYTDEDAQSGTAPGELWSFLRGLERVSSRCWTWSLGDGRLSGFTAFHSSGRNSYFYSLQVGANGGIELLA